MRENGEMARAGAPVIMVVAAVLALSVAFPALASPAALGLAVAAGVAFAVRDRIRLDGRRLRPILVLAAVGAVVLVWATVQPGYIAA